MAASGWEHAIRVRARAPTTDRLADDCQLPVIHEAATPGLPGEPGPNRAPLGIAADHKWRTDRYRCGNCRGWTLPIEDAF